MNTKTTLKIEIDAALLHALQQVAQGIKSNKPISPILVESIDATHTVLVATDGCKLVAVKIETDIQPIFDAFAIPPGAILAMPEKGRITLSLNDGAYTLSTTGSTTGFTPIWGALPKWRKVLPDGAEQVRILAPADPGYFFYAPVHMTQLSNTFKAIHSLEEGQLPHIGVRGMALVMWLEEPKITTVAVIMPIRVTPLDASEYPTYPDPF